MDVAGKVLFAASYRSIASWRCCRAGAVVPKSMCRLSKYLKDHWRLLSTSWTVKPDSSSALMIVPGGICNVAPNAFEHKERSETIASFHNMVTSSVGSQQAGNGTFTSIYESRGRKWWQYSAPSLFALLNSMCFVYEWCEGRRLMCATSTSTTESSKWGLVKRNVVRQEETWLFLSLLWCCVVDVVGVEINTPWGACVWVL